MRIVGCFVEHKGKILLLRRLGLKSEGDTWGPPGGKVEPGESDLDAIVRELYEETGIRAKASELEPLGTFVCVAPNGKANDWVVHKIHLTLPIDVVLASGEHSEFQWLTPEASCALPNLIYGVQDVMKKLGWV